MSSYISVCVAARVILRIPCHIWHSSRFTCQAPHVWPCVRLSTVDLITVIVILKDVSSGRPPQAPLCLSSCLSLRISRLKPLTTPQAHHPAPTPSFKQRLIPLLLKGGGRSLPDAYDPHHVSQTLDSRRMLGEWNDFMFYARLNDTCEEMIKQIHYCYD